MLVEVHVERRATRQMLDVFAAVQTELFDNVGVGVFNHIEIAIVAIARHVVAVFTVPTRMLNAYVFCWNHLAVEKEVLRAVFLVVVFHEAQDVADKLRVFLIVGNGHAEAFCSFHDAVHTDGQILALDVDIASIEERQHAFLEEVFEVGVVGHLHLMNEVDDAIEVFHIGTAFTRCLLHAAVDIDGQHTLGTR